ncbi:MAG: GGDEF domain-containing protein, partial [Alphaproteobacteria bacterium]|nr:GGDEF domain-containing protein [Alphaproteobacteria bacterium]
MDAVVRDENATAVTIAGLPTDRLSPEAEQVIEQLLADVGRLRADLDIARRHLADVELAADHHQFLPIFSRAAFRRQITHVLGHLDRLSQPPAILIVALLNGDAIRRAFGLAARDRALACLCKIVRATLGPNDILGSLTGNDLAALSFTDRMTLQAQAGEIVRATTE